MATTMDKMLLKKEEWLDLSLMASSSCYDDGKVTIYYQYSATYPRNEHTTTLLRQCLRAVGHKITKIENYIDGETMLITQEAFYTTITEEEGNIMTKLHNEYISEVSVDL